MTMQKNSVLIECVFISLFMIASISVHPYINLATLAVCIYVTLRKSYEDVLCMFMYLLSFVYIFKLQIGTGFALINIVEFVFLLRMIVKKHFKIPFMKQGVVMVFYQYAVLISLASGLSNCVKIIVAFMLGSYLFQKENGKYSLSRLTEYASAGVVVAAVIALLHSYFSYFQALTGLGFNTKIKLGAGLVYWRFSGLTDNPNGYTVLLSILIAVYALLIIKKDYKMIDIVYVTFLIIFGLMSSSMSFVVCLLITVLLVFLSTLKERPFFFLLAVFGGGIIMAVLYFYLKDSDFIKSIQFRIASLFSSELTVDEKTTGRAAIWVMYLEYFQDHFIRFLFGNGLGVNATEIVGRQAHNTFFEMLFYLGMIGSIFYTLSSIEVFGPYRYGRIKIETITAVPYVALFVRFSARCLLRDDILFFMVVLCSLSIWNYSVRFSDVSCNIRATDCDTVP